LKIKKIIAFIAIALTTVVLTGCSFGRDVESLKPYSPSDGVIADAQELKARNLLFIKGDGEKALLIGSFVNSTMEPITGTMQILQADGERLEVSFDVAANSKFDIGYNGTNPLAVPISESPGQLHSIFLSGGGDPITLQVPIMDGSLEEYRPFYDALY
jgi:hypothetical protein